MKRDELEAAVTNEESTQTGPLAQPVEQRAFNPRLERATSTACGTIPANPGFESKPLALVAGLSGRNRGRYGPMPERFAARVDRRGSDECWLWIGRKTANGYGTFTIGRRQYGAHRVAWSLANGDIPAGMQVHHGCDTPLCVNPAHLWLGTQKANVDDMDAKGRRGRARTKAKPPQRAVMPWTFNDIRQWLAARRSSS